MIKFKPRNVSVSRYVAVMGLLFAVASALNLIESILSSALPAGMRIGLSNVVIMTAMLSINLPSATLIMLLKVVFVFMTRGASAGFISLCGSMLAFIVTALLLRRTASTYVLISVLGSLAHTFGQLMAVRAMMNTNAIWAYAPVLLAGSVVAGICTGIVLKTVFPQIKRLLSKQGKL
ncbi:MAG: Gx transporter family protein [Ruminococcus sp.]|nr:Gx transporter family protein [Ruminococcus sp.]